MKILIPILIGLLTVSPAYAQQKSTNADLEKASKAFYAKLLKRGLLVHQPDGSRPVIIFGKPNIISFAGPSKIPALDKVIEIISHPYKDKCVVITDLQKFKGTKYAPYSLSVKISENPRLKTASKKPISSVMFRMVNTWNGIVEWQELYSFEDHVVKDGFGLSAKDIALAADKLANDLIAKSFPNDKKQVIGVGFFANRTKQPLPSELIDYVLIKLVQSDKFSVSAVANLNKTFNDPLVLELRKAPNDVRPPKGRLEAPGIALSGRVSELTVVNKEALEKNYIFQLFLSNTRTGTRAGSATYYLAKKGSKK